MDGAVPTHALLSAGRDLHADGEAAGSTEPNEVGREAGTGWDGEV